MAKTAQLKLTSEQRCRKAFEEFFAKHVGNFQEDAVVDLAMRQGWLWCWKYLERQYAEYVKS